MIQTIMLSGEQFQEDGVLYFRNVDAVVNSFLKEHDIEYVDLKVINPEEYSVLLIYKIKEEK